MIVSIIFMIYFVFKNIVYVNFIENLGIEKNDIKLYMAYDFLRFVF